MKKKVPLILLMIVAFAVTLFIGFNVGSEITKEEKKQIVHTKDLGNFAVKGDVKYNDDGSIQFTDDAGRKIRLRSYAAVVDASEVEQPKQVNKAPVSQPKAKKVPPKDTENKPDK